MRRSWLRGHTVGGWMCLVLLPLMALTWLASGGSAGALAPHRQDDQAAQATATREAELAEIADLKATIAALQTEVARLSATPTPTVEPTPAPPLPTGQHLPYGANWSVAIIDATGQPVISELTPTGVFVVVRFQVTNRSDGAQAFPFRDFRLRDAADRIYAIDQTATTVVSPAVHLSVEPSLPQEFLLVFDVLLDAGESFVVESSVDPAFRVQVMLVQRG